MRIECEELLTGRTVWPNAEFGRAETPVSVGEVGPPAKNDHSATHAPDVRARCWKRDRKGWASEPRIAWESVLMGGMGVAVAVLIAIVMLAVAAFGARFVA